MRRSFPKSTPEIPEKIMKINDLRDSHAGDTGPHFLYFLFFAKGSIRCSDFPFSS
jgi:hypothetical protein